MRKQYDLKNAKPAKKRKELKVQKTFRLDPEVLLWLEHEGEKHGMGYLCHPQQVALATSAWGS